jgi:hypothetical protein
MLGEAGNLPERQRAGSMGCRRSESCYSATLHHRAGTLSVVHAGLVIVLEGSCLQVLRRKIATRKKRLRFAKST